MLKWNHVSLLSLYCCLCIMVTCFVQCQREMQQSFTNLPPPRGKDTLRTRKCTWKQHVAQVTDCKRVETERINGTNIREKNIYYRK